MARSQKPRYIPPGAQIVARNRRAHRDYEVLETLEAGVVLQGSEVKSLRQGKAQLSQGWAGVYDGELWLHNLHIPPYSRQGKAYAPDPNRVRKLLAHRREITRLDLRVQREGLTLVPLALYFVDSRAKVALALARGRSRLDRRQMIAERDAQREAARALSGRRVRRAPR